MPPVEDGTERFMEILDRIGHGVHRLPKLMIYLLVPGLFCNHGPLYFSNTKTYFSKMGLMCHIAKIHSEVLLTFCFLSFTLKGDLQALEDLTYDKRREFLKRNPLPKELPVVSFHPEA